MSTMHCFDCKHEFESLTEPIKCPKCGSESTLTDSQRKAVEHFKGPLLIIAGPGAGKTRVIAYRVAHLVKNHDVKPENIIAVTFTNKAADELKDRIAGLIGAEIEAMQVSTIHSFCQTLLERYPDKHDYGRTFDVLDAEAQFQFVDGHPFKLGLRNYIGGGKRKRSHNGRGKFIEELINTYNKCSEHYVDPDKFVRYVEKKCADEEAYEEYLAVAKSYKHYLNRLRERRLIDFPGLQRETLKLLKNHKDILKEVRNRYRFLLIDEYQDTNPIQDEIFKLIAKPDNNICVVGDDDQSIYRFRGATVKNFQEFKKHYPSTRIVNLEENWRSTNEIVSVSQRLIRRNGPKYRMPKNLVSMRGEGNKVVLVHGKTDEEEAKTAAQLIKQLKERKAIKHYGDVAILFKSVKWHAKEYLKALKKEDIKYTVLGDGGFFERPEIRELLYLLNFLGREKWRKRLFESDWWTINMLKGEVLGLHRSTVEALDSLPRKTPLTDFKTPEDFEKIGVKESKDINQLVGVLRVKKEFLEKKGMGLLNLFYKILKATSYLQRLLEREDEAIYNVAKLSSLICKFEKHRKWGDVKDFLWYIHILPNRSIDAASVEPKDAVRIMTIHRAKGLEFPLVIIGSVTKGRFPREKDDENPYPVPEELYLRKLESHDGVHITDQRRLFYVGLARAEDSLIIGTAEKVGRRHRGPSMYVEEIGRENLAPAKMLTKRCERTVREKETRERISYSALNVYLSCPLRYKFLYVFNFETPAWYFQNYGKSLHLALETIHRKAKIGEKVTDEIVAQVLNDNWIPFRYGRKEREEEMRKLALELLTRYVREHSARFGKVVEVEKKFTHPTREYVLTGQIDLLIKGNGGVEIIDFKTRSISGFKVKDAELQLDLYALPISEEKRITGLVSHMLQDNKMKYFLWNDTIKERTKDKIRETCKNIAAGEFNPCKNYLCSGCEFKFACPEWRNNK